MSNSKYIQRYTMKEEYKKPFTEDWSEENAKEYARTAEFGLIAKMMMFADVHPIIWTVIISVATAIIASLILSRA